MNISLAEKFASKMKQLANTHSLTPKQQHLEEQSESINEEDCHRQVNRGVSNKSRFSIKKSSNKVGGQIYYSEDQSANQDGQSQQPNGEDIDENLKNNQEINKFSDHSSKRLKFHQKYSTKFKMEIENTLDKLSQNQPVKIPKPSNYHPKTISIDLQITPLPPRASIIDSQIKGEKSITKQYIPNQIYNSTPDLQIQSQEQIQKPTLKFKEQNQNNNQPKTKQYASKIQSKGLRQDQKYRPNRQFNEKQVKSIKNIFEECLFENMQILADKIVSKIGVNKQQAFQIINKQKTIPKKSGSIRSRNRSQQQSEQLKICYDQTDQISLENKKRINKKASKKKEMHKDQGKQLKNIQTTKNFYKKTHEQYLHQILQQMTQKVKILENKQKGRVPEEQLKKNLISAALNHLQIYKNLTQIDKEAIMDEWIQNKKRQKEKFKSKIQKKYFF